MNSKIIAGVLIIAMLATFANAKSENNPFTQLQVQFDNLQEQVTELFSSIAGTNAKITELEITVAAQEKQIVGLQNELELINSRVTSINNALIISSLDVNDGGRFFATGQEGAIFYETEGALELSSTTNDTISGPAPIGK